ncbi:MAG: helix-turn-helix domain-containing protein [Candidatus Limnocylindria bacterium]
MGQRPNELTPDASPRHLLGAELRAARLQKNMSLAELGKALHRNASYLAKIERAERAAPADLLKDCDEILQTHGLLERLQGRLGDSYHWTGSESIDSGDDHDRHVANRPGHVANPVDELGVRTRERASFAGDDETFVPVQAADGRIVYVPLPRRRFLQNLGLAAAGVASPALASAAGASSNGHPPVEHFRRMRATLADLDNLSGPQGVIPVAHNQVNLMQQLRRASRGADLKDVLGTQTEFADLLGWLHQDSGDHHAARFWLDRALEWANLAGNRDATVFVLARKSQLAGDVGDGVETVEVAEAAMRNAAPGSRLAAIAATYAVRGFALLGDRSGVAEGYDRARQMLDDAEPDELPWGRFFDTSYVDIHHAESRTLLGDYLGAAEEYRTAIAALPEGFRRDQGVYLAREALAYAGAEEAERAAELGVQALAIGTDTGSGRIVKELHQVNHALSRWTDVPSVREFCEAISATELH